MKNKMAKKDAIFDLRYVMSRLNIKNDVHNHFLADFIYNILLFHFGVSEKKLKEEVKKYRIEQGKV